MGEIRIKTRKRKLPSGSCSVLITVFSLMCLVAWDDVEGVPVDSVSPLTNADLIVDEISAIHELRETISLPKSTSTGSAVAITKHPASKQSPSKVREELRLELKRNARRLLSGSSCSNGLCTFNCTAIGTQANLPGGLGATGQSQCDSHATASTGGTVFVNTGQFEASSSGYVDFVNKCCVDKSTYCGTLSMSVTSSQRQQQHAADKSFGPNARLKIDTLETTQAHQGSGAVTLTSITPNMMMGNLTATGQWVGNAFSGEFIVPPHKYISNTVDTQTSFKVSYRVGNTPGYTCEITKQMTLGVRHEVAAVALDYDVTNARRAYEKELPDGQLIRSQGAMRKQIVNTGGTACAAYVPEASKTALSEAFGMNNCKANQNCHMDKCDLHHATVDLSNPHLTWCADAGKTSSTPAVFTKQWQRGFAEANVASTPAFSLANVPNEGNQRGCASSPSGNFHVTSKILPQSVKYMETGCQAQTDLQGTVQGTRMQTYRKQWGNNATSARQDRAPSIWHRPSESTQTASGEQLAPIDFIITDEQVHSGQCVAGNEGTHMNLQVVESQMTQMDALVCVRDTDQVGFLAEDDAYPKISNMFLGSDPDLRFEKYLVSDGVTGDAVVDGSATDYHVNLNPQATVFQTTTQGGDVETCFRAGSMTKAPLCNKEGADCGTTDIFKGEPTHTTGAHASPQAARILHLAAAKEYFSGGHASASEFPSSRLLQASVSDDAGADIKLRLDGDEAQLIAGPRSTDSNFDSCRYDPSINSTATEGFSVKSKYGLRLRAKAGFQRQIALRFTTYAEFGQITVRAGQLLSHDEATDMGAARGLVGETMIRVATRTTPGMLVFQPYADGALTADATKICGVSDCGTYGQANMNGAISNREQFHVAAVGDLQYYQPVGGESVWDASKVTVPDFQAGKVNGHVARYRDAAGNIKMSDTVRFDFVVHETTRCNHGSAQSIQKQSAIEQYFFNKKHCDSTTSAANKAISEGKTGRAKFHVSFTGLTGGKRQLVANEYGCGEEGWHHISKRDMDSINKVRSVKNWGQVMDDLLKSLEVQLPTDYSTQMCGAITYKAYLAVYDTRSCGHKIIELGSSSAAANFMKYQIKTHKPTLPENKYLPTLMNLRGNPTSTAADALQIQIASNAAELSIASIAFSPSVEKHAAGPDKACTPFIPFTAGCADTVGYGAPKGNSTCRFNRQNDAVVRAAQGQHVYSADAAPRDLDYLASLEVTDLTNLVSWHKYDTTTTTNEPGGFYSQLQSVIRHNPESEKKLTESPRLPILEHRSAETADATFVVARTFEVAVSSTLNSDLGESNAADPRMSASRQMLGAIDTTQSVPSNLAGGTTNRKVTRYSIFGSVDAFVAASGYDGDIFQTCIPCSTLVDTVADSAGSKFRAALSATGIANAPDAFINACKRSRWAVFGMTAPPHADFVGCHPDGDHKWEGNRLVPHNQDLFLLSRAFPAFAPRPAWRDPLRISVSLDNYEWINYHTLKQDAGIGMRVSREGIDRFTVLPQCNFDVTNIITEKPAASEAGCVAHWHDANGDAHDLAAKSHTVDEDGDTGNKLFMGIDVAQGHWDGACALTDTKGKDTFTYDNYPNKTHSAALTFEKSNNYVKFCRLQDLAEHGCGSGYTCLARAFLWGAAGASPANEHDARINTARLLTYFDRALAAQQETLSAGDRCSRQAITGCVADSTKTPTCTLAQYPGKTYDNIAHNQTGYDANQNTLVREYFSVSGPSAQPWLLSQNNQRGSTMMYNKCGRYGAQANTLGDWTSDRHTEHATDTFFPEHATGLGPSALSSSVTDFGVYESQQCSAFTPSGAFSGPTAYPQFSAHATTWGDAGKPKLSFHQNFNSVGRTSFAGGVECGKATHGWDSVISTGVQFQQTSETQTRREYRGGHIFVSTCRINPLTGEAAIATTSIEGRNIHVTPNFDTLHHSVENLVLNSRTFDSSNSANAQRFSTAWRSTTATSIQKVDTPVNGNAVTGRNMYLYEFDAKNWPYRNPPPAGYQLSARSDTMVGGIGNTFDSTVKYGDVRPVKIELNFTYGGHPVNDLLKPYTVLTEYNTSESVVLPWAKTTTASLSSHKNTWTFDLESSVINPKSRYQPTNADLAALPGVEEGSFLYTHSTHTPGLQASSFHQEDPVTGAGAGYRRIVFRPTQKNLDFRQIKITAKVTSKDSLGTTKELTASIDIPVVNVAGQAGICFHKHLTGEAGVVRPSNGWVVSDLSNRVCLGEHTSAGDSVGNQMEANLATTIAQSSVGSVDSFVPLPIGATSTTFSQKGDFDATGTFTKTAPGTSTGTEHNYEISCDPDTTCDYYQERAFLNVYASQPIQLAQQSLVGGSTSTNFTRFQPLDNSATQTKLIKDWVLGDINGAGIDHSDSITDLTKLSHAVGYSSVNNGIVTHTGATTVQYEVENPVNSIDANSKCSTLAKGGQLYRLPIAQSTKTCTTTGTTTSCTVGFKLDGVHHMNRLFYAAGSEVKENNEIDIHAFITTFSQTSTGQTTPGSSWIANSNSVMAINGDGFRTRSQAVKWKARVYTTADMGGICVDNISPLAAGNDIDINYYGTSTSFIPQSEAALLTKTADAITAEALTGSSDAHINAGVAIISAKVLEGGNAGFVVEIKDKTLASSGNDWVSLKATRAIRVNADGNTFGTQGSTDLMDSLVIGCHESVSEGAGYCADSGTSWADITKTTEAHGKIGAGNPSEKFKITLNLNSTPALNNAVGGHMLFCFASDFVTHLETRNLVKQCREFCVVAIDPDMKASTTCSAPGCVPGQKGAFASGSLGSVTCATTVPDNQANRAGLLAAVASSNYNKAYLDMQHTGPTDQYLITNRERSHHHDGNKIDLELDNGGDVEEVGATSTNGLSATLGATGGGRLVTRLVQGSKDQAKIDYETKLSGEIAIASGEIPKFTGASGGTLTLITSTKGLSLLSSARVLKQQVVSGQTCHGVESSITTAKSCPAQQTESTDLTTSNAQMCKLHRLGFAHTGDYLTTRPRACLVSEDESAHNTPAYVAVSSSGVTVAPADDACKPINLLRVGNFNTKDVLRSGLQQSSAIGSPRRDDIFPINTTPHCTGGPGNQRSSLQQCNYDDSAQTITGKNGLYSFGLDDLFVANAGGGCTAGPGVTVETQNNNPVSIVNGIDGLMLEGLTDTSPTSRLLKNHLPYSGGGIMESTVTSTSSTTTKTVFTMKQSAVDYLCQIALHRKAIWFEVSGKFSETTTDDRFITVAFVPKIYQGVVSLNLPSASQGFNSNSLLSSTGNELTFGVGRSTNANAVKALTHNDFGVMGSAAYGTSRMLITGQVANVWVRLKACAVGLITDRLSFQYKGPATGYNAMSGGGAIRLSSQSEADEVCASQWIFVDSASSSHKLKLDLSAKKGGGRQASNLKLSLCDNIEKQTGCLVIKGASAATPPSPDLIHITTVSNENTAIQYQSSNLGGGEVASGFAMDGGISCGSVPGKCGLEIPGTCAVSPQPSPGFTAQTASSLKYTIQLRSSANTQLVDPSQKNIGQVTIGGTGSVGPITVVSSHAGLCLEPMSGAGSGAKADAECFVGKAMDTITSAGVDASATTCRRVLTLSGPGDIKVRARVGLTQSVIDYIYVGRKCADDNNTCRAAAIDSTSTPLGARLAVVQLPSSEPNVAGAHASAIMSQFGMKFNNAPSYNTDTGKIGVTFEMGRYRPETSTSSTVSNCWVDEDTYGVDDLEGHGFGLSPSQPQTCTEWGSRVVGGQRGYSPRLMTIGVGNGLQIGKTKTGNAFSQDHKSASSCSPMRKIAGAWGATTTTQQFAEKLFNPTANTRATCQQMKSLVDNSSGYMTASDTMGDYFSSSMRMAYMTAGEIPSVQPQWQFQLSTDKSTTTNDAIRCGSRYKISGKMETSLNAVAQCHHEDPLTGNWVKSSTSTTTSLATGEEIAEVKIPITMRSYTATKPRASGSAAILHNTDAIQTEIVVYTKTSQSFTSVDVNLGKTTDLPRLYTEKIDLLPQDSASSDHKVEDGLLVHGGCFDDCNRYEGSGVRDCGCATLCQVPVTKDGDEIPNAFGKIKAYVTVEIPVADTMNGIEAGYVSGLRSFQEIQKHGIGAFNLFKVQHTATDKYEFKTDATHSRIILVSVWKRLLSVASPDFTLTSDKRPTWATSSATVGYNTAKVAQHNGNTDLLPDTDAFKKNTDCKCSVGVDSKWPKVEGFSAHAKCTFPKPVDFAFQLQVAKCGGDGVSAMSSTPGPFDPATNTACGQMAGEYKTVVVYIDYTNGQKFVNPKEIKEAARNFVLEGERVDSSSYPNLASAKAEADAKRLDGAVNAVLSAGQPYSLVAEIEDGDRILGSAMRLQQERSVLAIKHTVCNPHTLPNKCLDGRVLGQCGAKLDMKDAISATHALADIVLHPANTADLLPVKGDSATAKTTFDTNPWYKKLRADVRSPPDLPTIAKSFEVCYGGAPGGLTAKAMNQIPGKWCPKDRLKTAWDPAAEVVDFLSNIARKSCGEDNVAKHIWLCPASGNTLSSWCYWVNSIAAYDAASPTYTSCIIPSSIGKTAGQREVLFDGFATAYRFLTIVDNFAFQSLEVRQNNLVPYADLGSKSCIQWSGVSDAQQVQARYITPGATGADDCSQMSQLVTTNFESNVVIRGFTPKDSSFPTAGTGAAAARHIQCASATKSSIFPPSTSSLANKVRASEQGRAVATRNGLRTDITLGSATTIPCVQKMVFMQARITDTRDSGVCHRAKLTCTGNQLHVSGLSELKSAQGGTAVSTVTYKLLKPSSNNNDGNAVGGASATSYPKDGTPQVVPAHIEGWEFEIDSTIVKGSFSGRYKEVGSTKGVRSASGVLELSTSVDSLTNTENKYLYVNTGTGGATPTGFSVVSCGAGAGDDLPLQASDIQLGAASNLNGARRLLTIKTSDSRQYAIRRSGTGDQQVSITTTTPPGAAAAAVCSNSGVQCMPGYVWKVDYDTTKCSDNTPAQCTHAYCCTEHTGGDIHITNNAYSYSNKCNSLSDESTQRRLVFMGGMLLGILAILVLAMRAIILAYRSVYCEDTGGSNAPCHKPSLVIAAEILSIVSLIIAGIMGLLGQGTGEWIDICGLNNNATWPVWGPFSVAGLVICCIAMPHVQKMYNSHEGAAGNTNTRSQRATSIPINIL